SIPPVRACGRLRPHSAGRNIPLPRDSQLTHQDEPTALWQLVDLMRLKLHVIPVTQLFHEKARQMPVALSSVSWNKDSGLGIQDKMPFREIRLLRPRENGKISRRSTLHAALSQCRRTSRNPQWRKTRCDQAPASKEFSARQILSLHCFTSPKGCCLLHANTHS